MVNVTAATVTTVSAAPNSTTFGQAVTLTAAVVPVGNGSVVGTVTGTVTFTNGATVLGVATVVNGSATLTTSALPAGVTTVTATYSGNTSFSPSSGSTAVTVTQAPTTTVTTNATVTASAAAQTVALTATVTSPAGTVNEGQVTFTVTDSNGVAVGTPARGAVANGQATASFTLPAGRAAGTLTVTAVFTAAFTPGAPDNFTPSTGTGTLTVSSTPAPVQAATTTKAASQTVSFNSNARSVTLTATVTGATGGPVNEGTVTFTVTTAAGAPVGTPVTVAVVNGVANANFTLPAGTASGTDNIRAVYSGGVNFLPSQDATATLTVGAEPSLSRAQLFFAAGPDVGGGQAVQTVNPDGTKRATVTAFGTDVTGGVRVATADFNNDGVPDIVVGTGPGVATRVRVIDGVTGLELFSVTPFESTFTGGVFVAAGDLTGDGVADLVITPDQGGGPRVQVYDGKAFVKVADFFGIADPNFRGGARAAVGQDNATGFGFLAVAAGFGGGPRVAVFEAKSVAAGNPTRLVADFFAFEPTLTNGAFVAAGDLNGDGSADLIFGAGPGGGPRVRAFDTKQLLVGGGFSSLDDRNAQPAQLADFFVGGNTTNRGGVRVAAKRFAGDTTDALIAGSGANNGSRVTVYSGRTLLSSTQPAELAALDPAFTGFSGGVFVG